MYGSVPIPNVNNLLVRVQGVGVRIPYAAWGNLSTRLVERDWAHFENALAIINPQASDKFRDTRRAKRKDDRAGEWEASQAGLRLWMRQKGSLSL